MKMRYRRRFDHSHAQRELMRVKRCYGLALAMGLSIEVLGEAIVEFEMACCAVMKHVASQYESSMQRGGGNGL